MPINRESFLEKLKKKYSFNNEYDEWNMFTDLNKLIKIRILENIELSDKEIFLKNLNTHCYDNVMRMKILNENNNIKAIIDDQIKEILDNEIKSRKDNQLAIKFRIEGNDYFSKKLFDNALEKYSQALLYAENSDVENKNEISLCYGNRSAVYYHQNQFFNALSDINLALKYNYPKEKAHLLFMRKILCMKKLNLKLNIEQIWSEINDYLNETVLTTEITNLIKNTINKEIKITSSQENEKITFHNQHCNKPMINKSIKLVNNEEKGRYYICDEEIKPSELLFNEIPVCWWLKPSLYNIHCFHCLKKFHSHYYLPCDHCIQARYCSVECKNISYNSYHRYECTFLHALKQLSNGHLALRMLLIIENVYSSNVEKMLENNKNENNIERNNDKQDEKSVMNENEIFLQSLLDHSEKQAIDDVLINSIGTMIIYEIFKRIKIKFNLNTNLDDDNSDNGYENEMKSQAKLLRCFFQINVNSSSILSDDDNNEIDKQILSNNMRSIGIGIYRNISLMNHSCDKKIYPQFNGYQMNLYSIEKFNKYDEITLNYGFYYKLTSYQDRQRSLQMQYFFKCNCERCMVKEENIGQSFCCPKCNEGPVIVNNTSNDSYCMKCKVQSTIEIELLKEKHYTLCECIIMANEHFDNENYIEAKINFNKCIDLANNFLYKYNEIYAELYEKLALCDKYNDDYKQSSINWYRSYNIIEKLHGEINYDTFNCLINITDLLLKQSKRCDEKLFNEKVNLLMKAKKYFTRVKKISKQLEGKKFYVLSSRETVWNGIELFPLIANEMKFLFS